MEDSQLRAIVDRLAHRYEGFVDREEIADLVRDSAAQLEPSNKAPQFLPIMVERFTTERLSHLAEQKGLGQRGVRDVLFICNANAGRSQMAAAFANACSGGRLRAWSAGVNPLGELLPEVVTAMQEKGIDITESFSKPITGDATRAAAYVVSIGSRPGSCPRWGTTSSSGTSTRSSARTRTPPAAPATRSSAAFTAW